MPTRSRLKADRPVALLAGLARLAARPLPTGSVASAKTIEIVTVACFAASAGPVAQVTIRSTFALANSVAISAARSFRPSAHRASIWRLRPSVQPSSPSRCTRTESHGPPTAEVDAPRNPSLRTRSCCARAASGHATAAPPSSADELPPPHAGHGAPSQVPPPMIAGRNRRAQAV